MREVGNALLMTSGVMLLSVALTVHAAGMTFEVRGDDSLAWILASGPIEEADAEVFFDAFHDVEGIDWVVLDSDGGFIQASMRLGRMFRSLGFSTLVAPGGECVSACFFAFAGGVTRDVGDAGRLGVHQFYPTKDASAEDAMAHAQSAVVGQISYAREMGIDQRAVEIALTTPSYDMHIFSPAELRQFRLIWNTPDATPAADECPFPASFEIKDPLGLYPGCRQR